MQTSLLGKKASFWSIFAGKCVVNIFLYSHTNALSHSTHILIRIPSMLLPMLFTHGFNFIKFDILRCYKTAYFFICLSLRLLLRAFFYVKRFPPRLEELGPLFFSNNGKFWPWGGGLSSRNQTIPQIATTQKKIVGQTKTGFLAPKKISCCLIHLLPFASLF